MQNAFHHEILRLIQENPGMPTAHTFSDSYLGNSHPRYAINAPTMRKIGKDWMKLHRSLTPKEFQDMLTSLIKGDSSTEKAMAGVLMDCATREQRLFDPKIFDQWLNHLEGWAEVDSVCTGHFTITSIPEQWTKWKPLLIKFSKHKNIHKRRASLVLLCSPVRYVQDEDFAKVAFANIDRLKHEKEVLITKAISWLLRSMVKNFKRHVAAYVKENQDSLPKIAIRETMTVLKTGKKTK